MTLPTVAGVQSRILTIPDRPPFMLAAQLAEVFETTASNLMRQVRRNMDLFPDGFLIELSDEEYVAQLRQFGTTAEGGRANLAQLPQGARTDLTHFGFTEAGALMVPNVLRTDAARRAAPVLVRAFVEMRDAKVRALENALFKDEQAYIGRSAMRRAIKDAAARGWDFERLWSEYDHWSRPVLGREIEEMRLRGYIPQHALFVPPYVFMRKKIEQALLRVHIRDAEQARLGQEG